MNGLDFFLLCVVGAFLLYGIILGFVRLVLSWAFLAGGFIAASLFYADSAKLFETWIKHDAARNAAAFILIVFVFLVAGSVFIALFLKFLKIVKLRWLDKVAGGVVGAALGVLVSVLLIFLIVSSLPAGEALMANSLTAPVLTEIADLAIYIMPSEMALSYESGKEYLLAGKAEEPTPPDEKE